MRDRWDRSEHPGLSLLLQGRAGLEYAPRAQERRREGCPDVFRLLERVVARSLAADRRGAAAGCRGDREGGIEPACFFTVRRPESLRTATFDRPDQWIPPLV